MWGDNEFHVLGRRGRSHLPKVRPTLRFLLRSYCLFLTVSQQTIDALQSQVIEEVGAGYMYSLCRARMHINFFSLLSLTTNK